jgi:hypothetical protein
MENYRGSGCNGLLWPWKTTRATVLSGALSASSSEGLLSEGLLSENAIANPTLSDKTDD